MGFTRCLYSGNFKEFCQEDPKRILGILCSNYHGEALTSTREAWEGEIEILQDVLNKFINEESTILFEYDIPRLGKRIDVVLLFRGIIFCLEFKVGPADENQKYLEQVLDYALDLKNFHKLSHDKIIAPILIPTNHKGCSNKVILSPYNDGIINPLITGKSNLLSLIEMVLSYFPKENPIDPNWEISPYSPTPTIVEAAKALYENHSVEDIKRHEAGSTDNTISYILNVIKHSKEHGKKSICFVTGVPGAGKTLVGLEVAIKQTFQGNTAPVKGESAVYLSGNGPLVAVLTEALARDNVSKCKDKGIKKNITDARREIKESIQMIHNYRDSMIAKIKNPVENDKLEIDPTKALKNDTSGYAEVEHVAIFDEAQRSWTQKHLAQYLKRGGTYGNKIKVPNFPLSEAAFLIWSLDQREDWATIVCLVGGGQEINTGEAGIEEWIKALNTQFTNWDIFISSKLSDKEYAEGKVNELLAGRNNVTNSDDLHLCVSIRSFRAEKLSSFVHSLLTFDAKASDLYKEICDNYPLYITRDIEKARRWLKDIAKGSERTGVLVTKESARYKPLAVHVLQSDIDNAIHWFLDDKTDVRASNFLEDAATEIQVQGLELDFTCVLWDADMRCDNSKWHFFTFTSSSRWKEVLPTTPEREDLMKYMLNAYRVLLTRARKGMIICIPQGNPRKTYTGEWEDSTRLPEFYDSTFKYLKNIGIKEI